MSEDTRHKLIEMAAALAVSLIFFAFAQTSPYERMELLSLDARFNLRPPILTNADLATIDIDDRALAEQGRWQDWTRERHARIIDVVRRSSGGLLGFDIYFSEESEQLLRPADIAGARSVEDVHAAFRDYDAELAKAAKRAGNVYWGTTFVLDEEEKNEDSPKFAYSGYDELAWKNFAHMAKMEHLYIPADKNEVGSILQAIAPQAVPIPQLIETGRGVGFAQIRRETDGVVRKYPTLIRCDYPRDGSGDQTYLFPSIGLAMACDYLQVPLKNLKVRPGEYLEIPNAYMPDGSKKDLRIPINDRGEMLINWAGDYKDTFKHFPYASLTRLAELRTLEEMKALLAGMGPSIFQRPGELIGAIRGAFPNAPDSAEYAASLYGAHRYETLLEAGEMENFEPSVFTSLFGMAPEDNLELYEGQIEVFENVRLHMGMLELLSKKPGASVKEAADELGVSEETAENYHVNIRQVTARGGPRPADRPLYFLPPVILEEKTLSFEDLRGGIFFYGLTAAGTHDLNPMPFSPRYPMVGALANVFNTIVTDQFITPMPAAWRLPLFLAIGLFVGYVLSTRTSIRGSLFTLLFLVAYLLFAYWLFANRRFWIEIVGPAGIVLLTDAAIVWYKFNTAEKKRKFIRSAFEHYMNPAVVEQIAKDPDMLELGGKRMDLTAFFSDVASFTSISEKLNEHELVALLNEYLTEMTDIVLKHYGNLDKYEGDAIMAFFGAPIHFPDHAARACFTALEMQDRLGQMREKWKEEGRPELTARIGVNTGPMVVGNMGSRTRFDYTVMGDAVNLASRLEGVNKQYSTDIMISEFTLEQCKSEIVSREIDLIRVKGKSEPVRIHEVLARADDGLPDEMKSVIDHYSAGLEAYKKKDWEAGIKAFQQALDIRPDDGPSATYIKRCREYMESPPPDDWGGVYVMTTK